MKPWLGVIWSISNRFGRGIYGPKLVLELLQRKFPAHGCFGDIVPESLEQDVVLKLKNAIQYQQQHLREHH